MSFIAAGTTIGARLLTSGAGGGGAGAGAPAAPSSSNVIFGSVNYKSAGAGDKGKVAGASDAATDAAFSAASAVPVWVWIVGALGVVGVLIALLIPKKK